jgi:hypothetical protein
MKHWSDDSPRQGAVVAVPLVWLAFVLSLIIHIAVMWVWIPRMRLVAANPQDTSQSGGPLAVQLAQLPTKPAVVTPPTPPTPPQTAQSPAARPPAAVLRALPRPATPIIAAPISPVPNVVAPPPVAMPAPAPKAAPPPPIPADMDLSAYMAAKRRARGETESTQAAASEPAESEAARRDRIVAANLAAVRTPNLGSDPRNGGGLFEIKRLGSDDAEFMFYGWNKEIKRRVPQMIEVKKGTNGSIQIAMVRKMIGIIRDHEDGDFAWESRRLGRVITLSARASDNGELEAFMMKEFFETTGTPR